MMTLRLRRCVSLFVCLSLLLSACSPGKSSKAGSNVSEFTTRTSVVPQQVNDKSNLTPPPPTTFCDKHKWCSVPRDTWGIIKSDREIGEVGGFSVTPKRLAVGTAVAVLGTVALLFIGYKWLKKPSAQGNVKDANADDGNNIVINNNEGGGKGALTGTVTGASSVASLLSSSSTSSSSSSLSSSSPTSSSELSFSSSSSSSSSSSQPSTSPPHSQQQLEQQRRRRQRRSHWHIHRQR
jgi:hypothetical protein